MSKKIVTKPGKLAKVKATNITGLLRKGYTVGQVAKFYKVSRVALYAKFGDAIKGISGRGSRVTKKLPAKA